MNLNSPERLKALIKPHQWAGQTIYLRKISVSQWRELVEDRKHRVKSEEAEQDGFDWFALLLSKHLCNAEGALTHDSDAGRAEFTGLSPDELADLGIEALKWSGLHGDTAKKN